MDIGSSGWGQLNRGGLGGTDKFILMRGRDDSGAALTFGSYCCRHIFFWKLSGDEMG